MGWMGQCAGGNFIIWVGHGMAMAELWHLFAYLFVSMIYLGSFVSFVFIIFPFFYPNYLA